MTVSFSLKFNGLVFRESEMRNLLESENGEVGRFLKLKGAQLVSLARANTPTRTGSLRNSIHMRHLRDSRGQYIKVGSPLPYAKAVHDGTKPRIIRPKNGPVIRFQNNSQVVYSRFAVHPGTKGYKYLSKALTQAGQMSGISFYP